jgi:hypothetical protein
MGMGGQLHAPAALPPGKRPGTHYIGGWVGPRADLDGCTVVHNLAQTGTALVESQRVCINTLPTVPSDKRWCFMGMGEDVLWGSGDVDKG